MASYTISELLRADGVTRWHIVATVRQQSLAEHTYRVAVIVGKLLDELLYPNYNLLADALIHDADEILDGDIPTPTKEKYGIPTNGVDVKDEEEAILKGADLIEMFDFILDNAYTPHGVQVIEYIGEKLNKYMVQINPQYPKVVDAMYKMVEELRFNERVEAKKVPC
jgi:5'-deoxynucleotidase YfbR-like HD superfamily hydrolase